MASKYDQLESFTSGYEKHPELGLKTCKKRLQKDPQNTLYLLAQARFLYRLERHQEALDSFQAIKFASNEIPEPFIIPEIQEITASCQRALATFNYAAGPKLASLWKDTLDKSKGRLGREMRSHMFRAAWRDEYWDLAQQLFARLQKEFPEVPRYHFAWIAFSQLQANKMPKDDRMAQNLQLLAFRSLKAAVDNTLSNKITARKISSTHDLRLITQIYQQQGYKNELLSILQDGTIGVTSSVGKNDVEFIRREIELLLSEKKFKDLHDTCYSRLNELRRTKADAAKAESIDLLSWADDWFVWTALLKSDEQLKNTEITMKTTTLINEFLSIDPRNRNAGRLLLTHQARLQENLLNACRKYFDSSCAGRSCFEDLREFLPQISFEEQREYIAHINNAAETQRPTRNADENPKELLAWVAVEINALKFEYFLCISKAALPTKESLETFVSDALRVYKISLNVDKERGDEACILAVIGLIKLHHFSADFAMDETSPEQQNATTTSEDGMESGSSQPYLVQAICLLDFLRSNSPHNYGAVLLSILISQQLGLTSLAMKLMKNLRIKEMQHDTIDHLLYSRMSIIHPFPTSARHIVALPDRYKNPHVGLGLSLDWYDVAAGKIMQFMGDDLENIQFDKIFEFSEFKERFENSFSRALMLLESRRVARMTDLQRVVEGLPPQFEKWVIDNREFETIPDFEYAAIDKFESFITTRPRPEKYWLARHTVNDLLQTLLVSKAPYPASQLLILDSQIKYLQSNKDDKMYQLSPSEQLISIGWDRLQPLIFVLMLGPQSSHASSNVKKDSGALLDWLKDTSYSSPTNHRLLPQADILQDMFLRLEMLKVYDKFCEVALTAAKQKGHHLHGKLPADIIQKAKTVVADNAKAIRSYAQTWKKKVEKGGKAAVLRLLKDGPTGDDIMRFWEADWSTPGEIMESAIDALDGVIKVKL